MGINQSSENKHLESLEKIETYETKKIRKMISSSTYNGNVTYKPDVKKYVSYFFINPSMCKVIGIFDTFEEACQHFDRTVDSIFGKVDLSILDNQK